MCSLISGFLTPLHFGDFCEPHHVAPLPISPFLAPPVPNSMLSESMGGKGIVWLIPVSRTLKFIVSEDLGCLPSKEYVEIAVF